ncbi:MAG TPA: VOC family protein [Planctomycetia bacterium]|nr:VOC family protein [Planctomycetia bacterium]
MNQRIAMVALVVRDYDEAISFYREALGFELLEDTDLGHGKRWVRIAPRGGAGGSALLLARAVTPAQIERVGDQTGGRVFLFLDTDDFNSDHDRLTAHGVQWVGAPRVEEYGKVAVFLDLYGNRWDLVERRGARNEQ